MSKKKVVAAPAKKKKMGRPQKPLPANWRRIMTELASQGASIAELKLALHSNSSAWERWLEENEDFREARKDFVAATEAVWTRLGWELAAGLREGNAAVYIFNMKNRFGWRDRVDVSSEDGTMSPKPTQILVVGK